MFQSDAFWIFLSSSSSKVLYIIILLGEAEPSGKLKDKLIMGS